MGERPDMSALEGWCDDRYMQLIQSMWLEDPLARPTMSNVCEQLEDMWKASCFDYIVCTKVSAI